MTARCGLFAVERDVEARKARGEDVSRAFWEAMNTIYAREAESWDACEPHEEEDAPEFDTGTTWSDSHGVTEFEITKASEQERHPLVLAAEAYRQAVDRWLEQFEELAEDRWRAADDDVDVGDALQVIRWYHVQIQMKLFRAVGPESWEEDEIDALIAANAAADTSQQDFPSDADGSAKVALLGIERSFAGWSVLRDALPEAANTTLDLMRRLMRLRLAVDAELPGARAFKRPGFDDTM